MAFNKVGSPEHTVSVLKEDGKVEKFCPGCKAMTADSPMDRKAFAEKGPAASRCGKCGKQG